MKLLLKIISLLIIFTITILAQEQNPNSSFTISDKLSKDDLIDPTLGRYDAYQINVGKGDLIAFKLTAHKFIPFLLLISPSHKAILKTPTKTDLHTVNFDTVAFEKGNWDMYIIGDTSAFGQYKCIVGFASPQSVKLKNSSFCGKIKFLLKQSDANFLFLNTDSIMKYFQIPDSSIEINNENNFISFTIANFKSKKATIEKFKQYLNAISECLGNNYYSKKINPQGYFVGIIIYENTYKNNHYIIVRAKKWRNTYSINFRIGRE